MADCDHAPLAPSSADRLVMCPGSRRLIAAVRAAYPKDETLESREGTAAHWALAEYLNGRAVVVGQVAANGVIITDEMNECAEQCADHIMSRDGWPRNRWVEQLVKNPIIHPENYGTPDYASTGTYCIHIDDYKHGHRHVDVFENFQLLNYAALKIGELRARDQVIDKGISVVMTIHQPRAYHRDGPSRTWSITVGELEQRYIPIMRERFALAMTDDAPVMATDPTICEVCDARWDCEAATAAGYQAYEMAFSSAPLNMSPAAMGLELRKLRRAELQIKARVSGLEEQAMLRARSGGLPGWRVEHGAGRLVWNPEAISPAALVNTARALGVNIEKPDVITPGQALKAGLPKELVDAFTRRNAGRAELVPDDGTHAANIFSNRQR